MADEIHKMQEIFQQVLDAARMHGVADIEAIISTGGHELTRFANNTIHQNVAERTSHLSVRPVIDGRTARASTNRLDREGIRNAVGQAIAITRLTESNPDLLPLTERAEYNHPNRYFQATASATPQERALAVAEAI